MLFNREVGYLITLFFIDYDISIVDKFFSMYRRYKMSCKPLCLCDAEITRGGKPPGCLHVPAVAQMIRGADAKVD